MSTRELTARHKAAVVLTVMVLLASLVSVGLLLQERGPGNMGTGFLQGAGAALVAGVAVFWRVSRHPQQATRARLHPDR